MADSGAIPEGTPMWDPSDDLGCFIPVDPERRARSLAIWTETGRRLGVLDA